MLLNSNKEDTYTTVNALDIFQFVTQQEMIIHAYLKVQPFFARLNTVSAMINSIPMMSLSFHSVTS